MANVAKRNDLCHGLSDRPLLFCRGRVIQQMGVKLLNSLIQGALSLAKLNSRFGWKVGDTGFEGGKKHAGGEEGL
jgi:hypothetical protein